MSRSVIFNADDLGMSEEIDRGILRAVRAGLVKEVSVCMTAAPQRAVIAELAELGAGIGLHFCVTEGRALFGAQPGLTNAAGEFLGLPRVLLATLRSRLSPRCIERELMAQLDALQDFGVTPTHINGHHHAHAFPVIRDVILREAVRRACPHVRVPLERAPPWRGGPRGVLLRSLGKRLANAARKAGVPVRPVVGLELTGSAHFRREALELAARLRDDVVEWVVHPREGDTPHSLATVGARHAGPQELAALEDPELSAILKQRGYQAVGYLEIL